MKKIIYALLISLFFIPNVNAAEISCSTSTNLLKPNNFINDRFKPSETSPWDIGYYTSGYNGLIQVQPSTTYHFQTNFNSSNINPRRLAVEYYDKDFNYISHFNKKITSNQLTYNFTTSADTYYITIHIYNINAEQLNSNKYQLSVKTSISINEIYEWTDYEQCPVIEPEEPDVPVEPEEPDVPVEPEEPIIADTTLDNFYSIYISKLQLLFQYASENKFILGAITIIILFIVLEIILNLFRKGGYR